MERRTVGDNLGQGGNSRKVRQHFVPACPSLLKRDDAVWDLLMSSLFYRGSSRLQGTTARRPASWSAIVNDGTKTKITARPVTRILERMSLSPHKNVFANGRRT